MVTFKIMNTYYCTILESNSILIYLLLTFWTGNKSLEAQPVTRYKVPGVVVDYSPTASGKYIGSPSIYRMESGIFGMEFLYKQGKS